MHSNDLEISATAKRRRRRRRRGWKPGSKIKAAASAVAAKAKKLACLATKKIKQAALGNDA